MSIGTLKALANARVILVNAFSVESNRLLSPKVVVSANLGLKLLRKLCNAA